MSEETVRPSPRPTDGLGLAESHAALENAGYDGQFSVADGAMVHCHSCGENVGAQSMLVAQVLRLEGVSNPDEMMAVVAAQCPSCSASGVLTLGYGPSSTLEDSQVLDALRAAGSEEPGDTDE